MAKQYSSERAAALIYEAVDILKRAEDAPDSGVNAVTKIYGRTAVRDEILEKCGVELKRITFELGHVMEQEGSEAVAQTFDAIYRETEAEAKLRGPDSEAAQRLERIMLLVAVASKNNSRSRRQKGSDVKPPLANDRRLQRLTELTAMKILDALPPKD
ncbi:MAG TPA: hypothetical protein VGJ82_19850, partial [Thermoanaerobaculia bacterium]